MLLVTMKVLHDVAPELLRDAFNLVVERGRMLPEWKESKVVLLSKPGSDPGTGPMAFRPICMISELGKTFRALDQGKVGGRIE